MNRDIKAYLLDALPAKRPFALAFSGGGDSLALLKSLRKHPKLKAVLHVDHGLREGSDEEAEQAVELGRALGKTVTVLRWSPNRVTSGVQEKARQARYGLMGDYCRENGLDLLLTAHHADDQAETVLMRVKRASGWRGAAGMRRLSYGPVWPELAGVTLCRPALGLSRQELRAVLEDETLIEDPSNTNMDFSRIRARRELAARPGLRVDMLSLSKQMIDGVALERARLKGELKGYHITHEGQFSVPKLLSVPTLCLVAPIVGGQSGPASRSSMAEKLEHIASGRLVSIGSGCMAQWDGEILTLSRDPVAITGRRDRRLAPTAVAIPILPTPVVWDGRFLVSGAAGQLHPERRGGHVGFRVHYGRRVRVENLVSERLSAALTQK